jgi:multidrug efflux pump subunit AcrA (membrane-fusion protein)
MVWWRIGAVLAAVAALVTALHMWGDARERDGYLSRVVEEGAQALRDDQAKRAEENRRQADMRTKDDEHAQAIIQRDADLSAARTELDRLRVALRQRTAQPGGSAGAPPPDPGRTDGAGVGDLLAECGASVVGLAGEADRLAVKLTGLQEAVRVGCPECIP